MNSGHFPVEDIPVSPLHRSMGEPRILRWFENSHASLRSSSEAPKLTNTTVASDSVVGMWWFPKSCWATPQSSSMKSIRIFSTKNQPASLGYPHDYGNPKMYQKAIGLGRLGRNLVPSHFLDSTATCDNPKLGYDQKNSRIYHHNSHSRGFKYQPIHCSCFLHVSP